MRWFIRIVLLALAGLMAFAFLGPLAPEGTFIREWAVAFREAIPSVWGYPVRPGG